MNNFLLIILCVVAGWLMRRYGKLPEAPHQSVNAWIINIALPAVALKYIPSIKWNFHLILPLIMPLIVWFGAVLFVKIIAKRKTLPKSTQAALLLTIGLGNTSFVGFPLTAAYFGDEGLKIAVICDQITFVLLASLGILTCLNATKTVSDTISKSVLVKKLFTFPPFLGFIAALILPLIFDMSLFNSLLDKLSLTLVPLALFSVGLQLQISDFRSEIKLLSLGMLYKLIIAPALIIITALVLKINGTTVKVSIFEASMAPMITSAILATEYKLNPKLANIMVGIGIPISFLTTFLLYLFIQICFN